LGAAAALAVAAGATAALAASSAAALARHVSLGLASAPREQRQRLGVVVGLGCGRGGAAAGALAGALAGARLARLRSVSPLPSAQGMIGAFTFWVLLRAALVSLAPWVPLSLHALCMAACRHMLQSEAQ